MKKVTPVLYVEEIEPALPFWMDRLGFEKTAEVPHGDLAALQDIVRRMDRILEMA